jgi:hypothetical protein
MADSEDPAVLEVSSECKSALLKKQDSEDTDIMSNYSTSLEGSVVNIIFTCWVSTKHHLYCNGIILDTAMFYTL